jgi:hypothetical protein
MLTGASSAASLTCLPGRSPGEVRFDEVKVGRDRIRPGQVTFVELALNHGHRLDQFTIIEVPAASTPLAAGLLIRARRSPRSEILAAMPCWQYAQLTITVDGRASKPGARTILWHGPGQGVGENYSDSGQTVPELLNRFGADGWELAGLQDYLEGGNGSSYWEAARQLIAYTFKRPIPDS